MANEKNIQSRSIKLYDEEWEEFKTIKSEMDGDNVTDRLVFLRMMDFYKNPKEIKVDNPELIKKIEELESLNKKLMEENEALKLKVEELTNSGNDNAMTSQRLQLELEAAQEKIASLKETDAARTNRPANIFEVEVHPVPFYFLNKMAEYLSTQKKAEVTPGYILVDLFVKDLQNPRSNHLPYTVSTEEIKKVTEEYRKAHPEEN